MNLNKKVHSASLSSTLVKSRLRRHAALYMFSHVKSETQRLPWIDYSHVDISSNVIK